MKSFFTKLSAFLLGGVMFTVVSCHDYAEDIREINEKLEQDKTELTVSVDDLQKAIDGLKAVAATDEELAAAIEKLDKSLKDGAIKANTDAINAANDKIAANEGNIKGNAASIKKIAEETIPAIEKAFAAADKELENALQAKIDKKADASAVEALQGLVDAAQNDIKAINSTISKLNDTYATDEELATAVKNVRDELAPKINGLEGRVALLESGLNTANDNIKENAGKIDTLITDLGKAIQDIKDNRIDIDTNSGNIKLLMDADLITRVSALETAVKVLNDANLDERVKAIENAYASKTYVDKEIEEAVEAAQNALNEKIEKLTERVEKLEGIISEIQKIVYKPVYANGVAKIKYAKIGDLTLDGDNELTYKVYPASYAQKIVGAYNNPEGSVSFISFDVIPVLKSTFDGGLEVKGIRSDKDGEITVTVRPYNFGTFYSSHDEYGTLSAALVLNNNNDHFSTEYTNLTADASASEYDLVLYNGAVEYTAALETEVAYNDKAWKPNLFDGIVPMFKPATGAALSFDVFKSKFNLPAAAAISIVNTVDTNDDDVFKVEKEDDNPVVTAYLDSEKYNFANTGKKLKVTSTYKFSTEVAPAVAQVSLVDFPYTLHASATAKNYEVEYNAVPEDLPILADYKVFFKDDSGNEFEPSALEDRYAFDLKDSRTITGSDSNTESLFVITPDEGLPVSVKLAVDADGKNLAKAEDVNDVLTIKYTCSDATITGLTLDPANEPTETVTIVKTNYSFTFPSETAQWNLTADRAIDASSLPSCSRIYQYPNADIVHSANLPADQTIHTVLSALDLILKNINVNGTDYPDGIGAPVAITVEGADTVQIAYTNLDWNAVYGTPETYNIVATYERVSADVTINAAITVNDRNRAQLNFGDIAMPDPVVYTANYVNESLANVSFESVFEALTTGGYLGDYTGVTIDDILPNTQVVTTNGYEVICGGATHNFDGALTSGIKFDNAAENPFTVGFNYLNVSKNFGFEGKDMPKSYDYKLTLETDYHQIITVESGISFIDPKFDFVKTQNTTISSDNTYYWSRVNPLYYATADPASLIKGDYKNANIYSFAIDNVDMTDAFNVVKPDGTVIEADKFTANNVIATFSIEGSYPNINMVNNILTYGGKASYVDVTGKIQIANTKDKNDPTSQVVSTYPIENTIFTTNDAYANYRVLGYNPLGKLEVVEKNVTWDLSGKTGIEYFNVLHNFSLSDSRGFALINNASVAANAWVTGDGTNGFAGSRSVLDVYSIVPSYEITINNSGSVQGIAIEPNGVIKATVSNLANVEDVVINVKLNVTYPYAEDMSNEFTITIPAVQ